ncbi:DUF2927 domain-containing protein [Pseudohalocynthiibacter aestuariivivens]|nr:DUF2927 domain-containing protein [Pseudohalocynthiibacter aestuariivivens]QIE44822.1 DUF2927 domain-containing protein [Pseudohalocynthiibacter aestuariivivens]
MGVGLVALAACDMPVTPPSTSPKARPTNLKPTPTPHATGPSVRSQNMARYYSRVQANLLAQGLLRSGGGGVDTPYSDNDLLRNFERIAFYDEYERNRGLARSNGQAGGLRKWTTPVRMKVEFGDSVPEAQRKTDVQNVVAYADRLARITGHPISAGTTQGANFHVLIVGEDDRDAAVTRIQQLVPNINQSSVLLFQTLPRSIHCLVVAFSDTKDDHTYRRAIAFIRAEHPDLMRRSCIHEELAQGLGLANDSPRARPSIFNDDDEFALLTTHDEELLRLLYSPRLTPGMTAEEARPILRELIAQRGIGPS